MNNLKIFLLACFLAMGYNVSLANVNVVVQVTPSLETKNVGGVVQYNITASYNGTPSVGTEEKAGAVEWQFGGANATAGCTITPSAAETTWKTSNTRSLTGTGTAEGEHLLSFNMRARFEITDKNTGAHIKYAEYSGRGTAKLKITAGKFKIVITPTDNFPGRSKYRLGIGEMATISLVSLSAGKTVTIVPGTTSNPNPSGTGGITVSGMTVTAGISEGSGTIRVKAKVDGKESIETLGIGIVEPSGVVITKVQGPKFHILETPSVGFRGTPSILPPDVSFAGKVSFSESACKGTGEKLFSNMQANHNPGFNTFTTSKGIDPITKKPNTATGISDQISFTCQTPLKPPFINREKDTYGKFTWPIPYKFYIPGRSQKEFCTVEQVFIMDSDGNTIVTKGGGSEDAEYGEESSTPPNWLFL